jgi:HlyD family secretion protein
MKRKLPLIVILFAAAASVAVYYSRNRRAKSLVLTGIVTTDDVVVGSQIQGLLSRLQVKEGDTVSRGQLLAVIDADEMRADRAFYTHSEEGNAAQVKEGEAALKYQEMQTQDQIRQAEAQLAATEAQQVEAVADLERARLDAQRAEGLFKQGIVSAQANDQARTTYEAAKAHVDSLRKQVQAAQATVALARSNQEQIRVRQSQLAAYEHQWAAAGAQKTKAQVRLGYTEIRAPIDGIVDTRAALPGEVVNAGQAIVTLINPDDLWIRADVEETYIDRVRLGDKLTVQLPSGTERVGTVFYRGVDADYATQRDVSRTKRDIKTFEIRVRVDNSDRVLAPGMTAFVTLPLRGSG